MTVASSVSDTPHLLTMAVIIYNCNMFIIQAIGPILVLHVHLKTLKSKFVLFPLVFFKCTDIDSNPFHLELQCPSTSATAAA